jgi:hypothetical protein
MIIVTTATVLCYRKPVKVKMTVRGHASLDAKFYLQVTWRVKLDPLPHIWPSSVLEVALSYTAGRATRNWLAEQGAKKL